MPQMAPMNWLMLFFFMISIFLMFNSINYFSFIYSSKKIQKNNMQKINNNWKW